VEWEEEIYRRTEAVGREVTYERLKQLAAGQNADKKPTTTAGKTYGRVRYNCFFIILLKMFWENFIYLFAGSKSKSSQR
jgi:hypothetical protein